ncbi:hypothetical protein LXL04_028573 [Taraxacum kok-saghyz]
MRYVDDAVEVYGREEDICLCFYAATIVSLFETDAEVRFADLKTEGNKPIGPQFHKQIYYENESRTCPDPSSQKDQATIRTRPMHPKHPQVDICQPKTKDMCHIERPHRLDGNAELYHQQRHSHNMVPIPILLFDSQQKKKAKYYNQNQIAYITRPKIEIIGWNVVSDISTI